MDLYYLEFFYVYCYLIYFWGEFPGFFFVLAAFDIFHYPQQQSVCHELSDGSGVC